MKIIALIAAVAAFATLGVAAAQAEPGYSTANVNMRTGPDIEYPSVGVIHEGEPLYVEGCLQDESWCDVRWADNRGWVYSEYIGFDYHGQTAYLPDVGIAAFGIPVVGFVAADYWGRWYRGRPWYAEHARWEAFKWHPRVGWHAPPPGPRHAGWWRAGYAAPAGMHAPPEHGWRRPERHDRREDRRDDRRDHHDDRHDDRHDDHR
jgi:uncharacterized protein YraI